MPGDNWRREHRICCDPDHQEDWDDDRRNEIFHGLLTLRGTGLPASSARDSQHDEEQSRPKGNAGEHDHRLGISFAFRIWLLPNRRHDPSVFWQKLNQ